MINSPATPADDQNVDRRPQRDIGCRNGIRALLHVLGEANKLMADREQTRTGEPFTDSPFEPAHGFQDRFDIEGSIEHGGLVKNCRRQARRRRKHLILR